MLRRLGQSIGKSSSNYRSLYDQAILNPTHYWKREASELHWQQFPKIILSSNPPFYRWFPDGKMNITVQTLDRHLEAGNGSKIAYHLQSPLTGSQGSITYSHLHERVCKFAHALKSEFGINVGDRVIIYMSMTIESVIAMLACARIGAIHSVVFGGFSANELAHRIVDSKPKVIICTNAGKQPGKIIDYLDIVNKAIDIASRESIQKVSKIISFRNRLIHKPERLGKDEFDFQTVEKSGSIISATIVESNHPLYVLYTSGTTGAPKGIIRDHGGTATVLNHAFKHIFGMDGMTRSDGMFCTSDIGWVLGHSFIVYGPLIRGIRSVLFEGKPVGTPDAGVIWEIISRNKINHLYTSPTAMRSIRKEDPSGKFITKYPMSDLKGITLVGERCDIACFQWLQNHFPKLFINDSYWQTESGGPIITNYFGLDQPFPFKPGSACKPVPGYQVAILHPETKEKCKANESGVLHLIGPLPPSFMLTLYNNDEGYVKKYFPDDKNLYNTGDSGYMDEDGYIYILSRVDDIINTAGHRLSTGEMEEVLLKHSKIAEAIVIGGKDEIKGEVPIGFVTIKQGAQVNPKDLEKELIAKIRDEIGPVASFKTCYLVDRLPKTRSGKYLRNVVRNIFNKEAYKVPSTVDDLSVVYEIESFIHSIHASKLLDTPSA